MSGVTTPRDPDHLIAPHNTAVVFIDYQPEQVETVGSQPVEAMMLNAVTVARAAAAFELPVVLSTVGVELGVNSGTIDEFADALPDVPEIDRTTLNSWEDDDFRAAVEATALGLASELQRDWGRDNGDKLRTIVRWYLSTRRERGLA